MKKKTAVYIDGKNIPAKKSERILKAIRKKGGYDFVKVYGLQKDPATKAWTKETSRINGAKDIRLSGSPQKNKVDNKIKQDIAKDIRSNRMETVVIVSSDHGYASSAEEAEEKTGRASDEYRKAMLTALRSNFRQISDVLQEGVDADGGYLVPEEYDKRLIDVLEEENIMRGLATKITTSGEHKINIAATKPAAAWIEEGGALTFGDATFDQIFLDAFKLHVAIKVTEELLYDNAFGLENYITTQFGRALANAEEDAFLNGDGNGKPTGLFHATKGGTIAGTTAA